MSQVDVYIGLGSNLGDRRAHIECALKKMSEHSIKVIQLSSILETDAVEYTNQPPFLNCIALVHTGLTPHDLLAALLDIESQMGRIRTVNKGPRIIDLDILLYGNLMLSDKELTLPHPGIVNRWFILKHLIELNPKLKDPSDNTLYSDLYNN